MFRFLMKKSPAVAGWLARVLLIPACLVLTLYIGIVRHPGLARSLLDSVSVSMAYAIAVHTLIYSGLAVALVGCILVPVANIVRGWQGVWVSVLTLAASMVAAVGFTAAAQGLWLPAWPLRLVNYTIWAGPQAFTPGMVAMAALMVVGVLLVAALHLGAVMWCHRRHARRVYLRALKARSNAEANTYSPIPRPAVAESLRGFPKPGLNRAPAVRSPGHRPAYLREAG